MNNSNDFDPILLDRFLAGSTTAADRVAVAAWVSRDPRNAALLSALQAGLSAADASVDTDASWQALHARIGYSVDMPSVVALEARRPRRSASTVALATPGSRPSMWRGHITRLAAAMLLAVGGTTLWQYARPTLHEFSAPLAQRSTITLNDGTKVVLAAGSRLQWRGELTTGARELSLQGEGYFDVVHDATRPFRVRSGDGIAEDIGTRFVVRAWPELGATEVVVEQGTVALSRLTGADRGAPTTLQAGDRGRLSATGPVVVTRGQSDGAAFAWTHGELVFNDTPLSEALPSLSRWYNADLRADAALGSRRLTARFTQQPLADLLAALALALDARVDRQGTAVFLRPTQ